MRIFCFGCGIDFQSFVIVIIQSVERVIVVHNHVNQRCGFVSDVNPHLPVVGLINDYFVVRFHIANVFGKIVVLF